MYQARVEMGRQLARENRIEADIVVLVPDSGVCAALGYPWKAESRSKWRLLGTTMSDAAFPAVPVRPGIRRPGEAQPDCGSRPGGNG